MQNFNNFQYSKTMSSIFEMKKLVNFMNQPPNLGRLLCRSKQESELKNHILICCRKTCVSCPYLLKAFLYQFKQVNKTFLLRNSFNCKSSNLIYAVICQGCQEEYRRNGLFSERANKYFKSLEDYFIDKFKPLLNKKT